MDQNPHMGFLGEMIRAVQAEGAVVVASAGNDASHRRRYPAAFREVVGVGGLGPYGPASTTNYGRWVRACAPSTDLVSTFFEDFDGPVPVLDVMGDADHFAGWATWSGTSFAVPIVVAALAREMARCQCNAKEAVERVIDDPALYRIPGLGTVVNLALGSPESLPAPEA
jgi:Subtilase family